MSTVADKTGRRRHDAAASRRALVAAAAALFEERGYEAATVREIGERAAVDPALIARYFGGKEGLYLATVAEAPPPESSGDPLEVVERVLRRTQERGLGPIGRALVSPTLTEAMRDQVRDILAARTVEPMTAALARRGVDAPRLRAELLVATALGVALARAGGALPALGAADHDEVVAALGPAVEALCGGAA